MRKGRLPRLLLLSVRQGNHLGQRPCCPTWPGARRRHTPQWSWCDAKARGEAIKAASAAAGPGSPKAIQSSSCASTRRPSMASRIWLAGSSALHKGNTSALLSGDTSKHRLGNRPLQSSVAVAPDTVEEKLLLARPETTTASRNLLMRERERARTVAGAIAVALEIDKLCTGTYASRWRDVAMWRYPCTVLIACREKW